MELNIWSCCKEFGSLIERLTKTIARSIGINSSWKMILFWANQTAKIAAFHSDESGGSYIRALVTKRDQTFVESYLHDSPDTFGIILIVKRNDPPIQLPFFSNMTLWWKTKTGLLKIIISRQPVIHIKASKPALKEYKKTKWSWMSHQIKQHINPSP